MTERILIIEDEEKIARLLELELTHEGYETGSAGTGKTGLRMALEQEWSLILLDVMLPELNGLEVLRRLRQTDPVTPIIMITARGTTPDIVSGLDQGANDYISKPFRIEELLARIRSSLRISGQSAFAPPASNDEIKTLGTLRVHPKTREVFREGDRIELTPKEFELLQFLMDHRNEVCPRERIIQEVWGYEFMGDTNIVDVYIRYLRKKLDQPYPVKLIQTVRGVGYSLSEPETRDGERLEVET